MAGAGFSIIPIERGAARSKLYEDIQRGFKSNHEWFLSYNNAKSAGLMELLQCFISCAGCISKISIPMIRIIDYQELVDKFATEGLFIDEDLYPLHYERLHATTFRMNFQEFLDLLFRSHQWFVLLDIQLLEYLVNFINALCCSDNRKFRHTGTFIGVQLTTAIVDASTRIGQGERLAARLTNEELNKVANMFHGKLEHLFKSLFKTGLWDGNVKPVVRSLCIREFGVWVLKLPQIFFDMVKLHYFGRLLSDEITTVQINCIQVLQLFFDCEELYSEESRKLTRFTIEFKHLIIGMALKINNGSAPAIKLLTNITKKVGLRNIFMVDEYKQVQELIYSPNRSIGKAAGSFCITSWNANNLVGNASLIKTLISFLIESKHPERVPFAVDSLIDEHQVMTDWNCMTGLLLNGHVIDSKEFPLKDKELDMLIKVMVTCVKQASTGEIPERQEPVKSNVKKVKKDQKLMTEHFIPLMKALLDKYPGDSQMTNLLVVPRHFGLSIKITTNSEKELVDLLENVVEIFAVNADQKVLEASAQIFNVFSKWFLIYKDVRVQINVLIDRTIDEYLKCTTIYRPDVRPAKADYDKVCKLCLCMKRLAAFYSCCYFNYGDRKLFESVIDLVERGLNWGDLPEDVVQISITASLNILMADIKELSNVGYPYEKQANSVKTKLNKFLDECRLMMRNESKSLRIRGFNITCDLYLKFGKPMNYGLFYIPTAGYETQLVWFIDNNVFGGIFSVADRRRFLASFCKLIKYKIIGVQFAASLFKNYLSDFGDIIKETLITALENNLKATLQTFQISLSELFTKNKRLTSDRKSPAFINIKELAKNFSNLLESDNSNVDSAVFAFHINGIGFSANPFQNREDSAGPPPNVGYLEILSEFSQKLSKRSKDDVLKFLESSFQNPITSDNSKWVGYEMYRGSLLLK